MPRSQLPYSEWTEEQRAANHASQRRWREKNREHEREKSSRYYWENRAYILAQKRRERHAPETAEKIRQIRRDSMRRQREYRRQREEAIAARMEGIERDATRIFLPNPEWLGVKVVRKGAGKSTRGETPAATVAARLARRKGEPILTERDVATVMEAARRKRPLWDAAREQRLDAIERMRE